MGNIFNVAQVELLFLFSSTAKEVGDNDLVRIFGINDIGCVISHNGHVYEQATQGATADCDQRCRNPSLSQKANVHNNEEHC